MLEKIRQHTLALGALARVAVAAMLFLLLAGAVALAWRLMAPEYQVLFSELDAQDASAIISELERMKVMHRLQDEGRTILVESHDVYPVRLKLMSKGVNLRGTVGFELFSESDFGMTEFAQKINYQRAMQGELARTIMALEEVRAARVHLVIPDSGLLRRGDSHGKASITITTRPGRQLQPAQVLGIQRLVAAAVPQIEPAAVTILDNRGVALNAAADADSGTALAGGDARLDIKRQTEAYFIEKAGKVLDRAVGPGRAIVTVDALLNHEALKVTQEQVLVAAGNGGEGAVVRSKQTSQSEGRPRAAAGAQTSDAGAAARSDSSINEVEFQHGKRIEQIVTAPGAIRRLSVGVVLPETLPPARAQKLTEVVSMAVGLNQARGDAIAVYSLETLAGARHESQAAEAPATDAPPAGTDAFARIARPGGAGATPVSRDELGHAYALPAALLILALSLAMLFLRRRRADAVRLSDSERVRMLHELQEWLAPRSPGGMR